MTEVVLDASVVAKWFSPRTEEGQADAHLIRKRYGAGELLVVVPPLLFLELINLAARRWAWEEAAVLTMTISLEELDFEVGESELAAVAAWASRGLTAYDAAYVALAEARGIRLVTDDQRILEVAPGIAMGMAAAVS